MKPVRIGSAVVGEGQAPFIVAEMPDEWAKPRAYLEQDGSPLPMTAPVAMQMGIYAGKAILSKAGGTPLPPFRYRDKGSMATIGRNSAVASAFGMNFRGYPAWLVWLLLHLYYLIGFRNRIVVMLNWVWYYWFHERQVRLITRRESVKNP